MESILFLALTLALHITFCQYQFMLLKVILEGLCANMNILKYCTTCAQYFWNTLSIRIWHQLWPCWVDIALLGLCIAVAQDREAGYWEYSLNTWEYSLMDWPPSVASFLEKSFHSKTPVLHWSSLKKLWFTPFFKATNPFEVDVYLQW